MPGSMPYSLEKGPYLSVIEDYVNGDRERALDRADLAAQRRRDRPARRLRLTAARRRALQHRRAPRSLQAGLARLQARRPGRMAAAPAVRRGDLTHHRVLAGVARRLRGRPAPHADPRARGEPRDPAHPGGRGERHSSTGRSSCSGAAPSRGSRAGSRGGRASSAPEGGQVTVLLSTPSHGHPLKNTPLRTNVPPTPTTPRTRRPPSAPKARGSSASGTTGPGSRCCRCPPRRAHVDVPDPWPRLQQRGSARHREPGGVGGRRAEPTHTMGTPRTDGRRTTMPETDVAMELVQQDVTAALGRVAGAAVRRPRVRGAADERRGRPLEPPQLRAR